MRIERTEQAGLLVFGSQATVEALAVRDIAKRAKGDLGSGIIVAADTEFSKLPASATLRATVVQNVFTAGLAIAGAEATATDLVVQNVGVANDGLADGVVASAYLREYPDFAPAALSLNRATVEGSARAGLASFGATVDLANSRLSCNVIQMNHETAEAYTGVISDGGGNVCECDGETESACKSLSRGLAPPAALDW